MNKLTSKEEKRVLEVWPDAECLECTEVAGDWNIYSRNSPSCTFLGSGTSEAKAWDDAASRINGLCPCGLVRGHLCGCAADYPVQPLPPEAPMPEMPPYDHEPEYYHFIAKCTSQYDSTCRELATDCLRFIAELDVLQEKVLQLDDQIDGCDRSTYHWKQRAEAAEANLAAYEAAEKATK
jgi:hypothetical protein